MCREFFGKGQGKEGTNSKAAGLAGGEGGDSRCFEVVARRGPRRDATGSFEEAVCTWWREKKPRAAAAAGATVPPGKVGQAVLQSPARAPSTAGHSPLPRSPRLCSRPATASPAPKAAALGLGWHQPLIPVSGWLFGPALVALGEGGSVGALQEERQR